VGGQARDQKRLGRGGDDRGCQARSAGLGLTADEVGTTLAEGKNLLGELGRLILQTQMEEFITRARVCGDCLKLRRLRDQRTRKDQTLFGTISVDARRISACRCRSGSSFVDVSLSP
jgi:hypothetical protein